MDYKTITERYYYKDGFLYNRVQLGGNAKKDALAGFYHADGYWMIKHKGKLYKYHRVIYCYFNECGYYDIAGWDIDHLDNDRGNNNIENLILCEHWENQLNRIDTKRNGEMSVSWKKQRGIKISQKQRDERRRYNRDLHRRKKDNQA